ncbi:MAG TPA: HK97 gp10 family phage protein [Jiangellaceae bacterium]
MVDRIKVEGLAEFNRSLRKMDKELPKKLRLALNDAGDIVVDFAQSRVPKRSGRAQRSIKARSTRTLVRVAAGGPRAPYYPWLDFGGTVGPKGSVKRPFFKEGRYLYKALVVRHDAINRRLESALISLARDAGLEVT